MKDFLDFLYEKALYIVNPSLGVIWSYIGDDLQDLIGLDEIIAKVFKLFSALLPLLHRYLISLIFEESVQICRTTGETFVNCIEMNFSNVSDLSILYFLFGLMIFVFVIKLTIHIVSGIIAMI